MSHSPFSCTFQRRQYDTHHVLAAKGSVRDGVGDDQCERGLRSRGVAIQHRGSSERAQRGAIVGTRSGINGEILRVRLGRVEGKYAVHSYLERGEDEVVCIQHNHSCPHRLLLQEVVGGLSGIEDYLELLCERDRNRRHKADRQQKEKVCSRA